MEGHQNSRSGKQHRHVTNHQGVHPVVQNHRTVPSRGGRPSHENDYINRVDSNEAHLKRLQLQHQQQQLHQQHQMQQLYHHSTVTPPHPLQQQLQQLLHLQQQHQAPPPLADGYFPPPPPSSSSATHQLSVTELEERMIQKSTSLARVPPSPSSASRYAGGGYSNAPSADSIPIPTFNNTSKDALASSERMPNNGINGNGAFSSSASSSRNNSAGSSPIAPHQLSTTPPQQMPVFQHPHHVVPQTPPPPMMYQPPQHMGYIPPLPYHSPLVPPPPVDMTQHLKQLLNLPK